MFYVYVLKNSVDENLYDLLDKQVETIIKNARSDYE